MDTKDLTSQDIAPQEALREALLKLQQARREEKRLRQESKLHSEMLAILSSYKTTDLLFTGLSRILRKSIGFSHALALCQEEEGDFRVSESSSPTFRNRIWTADRLFQRVLNGHMVACFSIDDVPEWSAQDEKVRQDVCSALHFMLETEQTTVIVILVHPERGYFTQKHVASVKRFAPLLTQALVGIDAHAQQQRHTLLEQENEKVQSALNLLEQATQVLGIGSLIWNNHQLEQLSPTLELLAEPWGGVEPWWSRVREQGGEELERVLNEHHVHSGMDIELHDSEHDLNAYRLSSTKPPNQQGILVLITDITQQRLANQEIIEKEEKFRTLFRNSLDTIILHDLHGNILDMNPQGFRMFGYVPEELSTLNLEKLHPSGYSEKVAQARKTLIAERAVNVETVFAHKDGQTFEAEVATSLFELKGKTVAQGIIRDITERRRSEQQLRELGSRLTSLIKNLHAGVLLEDENRKVVLSNDTLCTMFSDELTPEQLVGMDCGQMAEQFKTLFQDPEAFIVRVDELLEARVMVTADQLTMANGRIVERDYIPIFTEETYKGHLWQYQDVTEKHLAIQKLAASEALNRAVLDTSIDGHITIDSKGMVAGWNPAAEQTFGYTYAEAIGKPMEDLIVPVEMRQAHRNGLTHRVLTGEGNILGQLLELTAVRRNGERFPCEVSITSLEVAGEAMFAGHIRDITDRKHAQKALEDAKEAAESASQAKSNFLAVMSHEMRTPLNAILGMTQLVMGTELNSAQIDYLETVDTSAEALLHLINEVLDLSKIEAGQLVPDIVPFDLNQVTERVTRLLKVRAQDKGVRLRSYIDTGLPQSLMGDPLRIRQVLVNLIGNAVKFTQEGEVRVTINSDPIIAEPDTFEIYISIEDTGVGIPKEQLEHIFDRFYQVDSSTRRTFGGTGLGLNISRHLVELMGGTVHAESELGVGSCFHIKIPMKYAKAEIKPQYIDEVPDPANISGRTNEERTNRHILLVEDNIANNRVARRFLEGAGYTVDDAFDGQEAIVQARARRYDVILMDLQMPLVDGFDATAQIRDDERLLGRSPVPIIAVTAHATKGYQERCLASGMDDYLPKPIRRISLLEIVDRWVFITPPILVVDDAPEMRLLIERYLAKETFCTLYFAKNGKEALKVAEQYKPKIILMDVEMPGMNGLETVQKLRAQDKFASIPIVAMTGHTSTAVHNTCREAGYTDVLVKPIRPATLTESLKFHLLASLTNNEPELEQNLEPLFSSNASHPWEPIFIAPDPDLADLVPGFLENCRKTVQTMPEALSKRDFETLRIAGHNFKGTAEPYGFRELGVMGAELELRAKNQETGALQNLIEKMQDHLSRVVLR